MSTKSWLITAIPMIIGSGFTLITFITGQDVNETHVQLLDYLLYLTIGSGSIGAANAGFKRYKEYKKPTS